MEKEMFFVKGIDTPVTFVTDFSLKSEFSGSMPKEYVGGYTEENGKIKSMVVAVRIEPKSPNAVLIENDEESALAAHEFFKLCNEQLGIPFKSAFS